ncbi:MAG: ATP-dependent helicase, partial [Actinobacteria bacterium]|nr:ATP-dependent helicase [Actinomycetota bacterium]
VSILLGPRLRIGARDLALLGARAAELAHNSKVERVSDGGVVDLRAGLNGRDPLDLPSLIEAVDNPGPAERYGYSDSARPRLAGLSRQLEMLRGHVGAPLPELVSRIVSTIGLDVEVRLAALTGDTEVIRSPETSPATRGLAAIHSFIDLVHRYCAMGSVASLAGFLAWVHLVDDLGGDPELDVPAPADSVTLLTVHKAKGLEWEVVAVPCLSEGVFPTSRSRPRWTTTVGEIPHRLRGDADRLVDLRDHGTAGHGEFAEGMKHQAEAEERRLAYVATTRPTRLLFASGHWWGPTQIRQRAPSRYLSAAHETLVEHPEADPWVATSAFDANPELESEPSYSWPPDLSTPSKLRRDAAVALTNRLADGSELPDIGALSNAEQTLAADWDRDIELLLAERAAVERPTAADLPMTLSTTELLAARKDPAAFMASRRRPVPRRPSPSAARGTRFHTWVEERFGQRPLFEELPGALDEDLFMDTELAELQAGFLKTLYADLTPHAVEVPFAIVIDGRLIKGRIDAVYLVDGRWQVVDWKTNLKAYSDPTQLAVYRAAWAQLAEIPEDQISGVFVYVRRGEVDVFDDLPPLHELLPTS